MAKELIAGRSFGEVYRAQNRADLHDFLVNAVEASGGRVLYASDASRAPVYLGVQLASDERIGMLVYPFRITDIATANRPPDEVRGQLRYGSEKSWLREHAVSRDVAGVDVTMILGIDPLAEVAVGLDANLWDPLPMGISFYLKRADVESTKATGWHVWEKRNRPGTKRADARSPLNLETMVAFTPPHLIDYARLERRATALRLDPPLRFIAAQAIVEEGKNSPATGRHVLEEQFALNSEQILDIIGGRNRLAVAVRGGVAEYHLEQQLDACVDVHRSERLDVDAFHDFDVELVDGRSLRVECKNVSPKSFADGTYRVEVQKTRASKADPASRLYRVDAFDAVAACLFSATGHWEFRFARTRDLDRHKSFADRLAPIQRVDSRWVNTIGDLSVS
ncbi:hypothetical protein [Microbacterium sp. AR7-10]|uniref:hypothetical protein n=1 Tax=Microbacterium sp. AR7-10 TaxID=1891970 RepID=UPI0008FC4E52|nr:hypothetical protein [Microbacterium sp. AR7-10]OIU88074.1 hypothetical protein BFN01_06190 [Microbacterium sp. AR7-10]